MTMACHLCGAESLVAVTGFEALARVTSDCRPWPAGGRLSVCTRCGAVQKPATPQWREECARIYGEYALYTQSGGEEQPVFDQTDGTGAARSWRLLERVLDDFSTRPRGALLDFGCGNGAMLRTASKLLPGWWLDGVEPHGDSRAAVASIDGVRRVYGTLDEVTGDYRMISLIHSLEHVEEPVSLLRALGSHLADDGILVVEVPFHCINPFELLVADHRTHFDLHSLRRAVGAAGLAFRRLTDSWVPKELTAVAGVGGVVPLPDGGGEGALLRVEALVEWLNATAAWAQGAPRGRLGLFGTANAAGWLAGVLGDVVGFFVDEDRARVGRTHLGRPVISPDEVPRGATVLVALSPSIARKVAARLARDGVDYRVPPPLPTAALPGEGR
ncbi:class I SAM-dependent methyltransferase [Endothiovibrio diazotrophicus]